MSYGALIFYGAPSIATCDAVASGEAREAVAQHHPRSSALSAMTTARAAAVSSAEMAKHGPSSALAEPSGSVRARPGPQATACRFRRCRAARGVHGACDRMSLAALSTSGIDDRGRVKRGARFSALRQGPSGGKGPFSQSSASCSTRACEVEARRLSLLPVWFCGSAAFGWEEKRTSSAHP